MKNNHIVRGKAITISNGKPSTLSQQLSGKGGKEAVEETKRRNAVRGRIEDLHAARRNRDPLEAAQ
jgi:hypothetical protein